GTDDGRFCGDGLRPAPDSNKEGDVQWMMRLRVARGSASAEDAADKAAGSAEDHAPGEPGEVVCMEEDAEAEAAGAAVGAVVCL
ncbi:hypothetical protein E2562_013540, partial [Oryza meyeriana var. granulata]